jgi:2-polyprenyl-3-methyl-5-hydroxy-6-metoxy-1,4-benzoquinol methylase
MKGLPDSEIYEQELLYMPYRESLKQVFDYVCQNAPENGTLIDLMCGPGYLLGKIASKRKDLKLKGLDIDERYIPYAKKKYPHIDFELGDILKLKSQEQCDVVICTGSLHHIPYSQQENAVQKMASMFKSGGFVLISDCYIDNYSNETERKIAAAKLGYEYLRETIQNGAPESAVKATMEILENDVLMKEFKTSMKKRLPIFKKFFGNVDIVKTWPTFESEYGDYIFICKNSKGGVLFIKTPSFSFVIHNIYRIFAPTTSCQNTFFQVM